ncbi:hypothetical protein F5Y01DRAFT_77323 [Xylaria sp. FL0043]|nr:hypothetical protein F5Y01DRAFT_77323 [Xylaria sp. FL0043]
MISTLYFYCIRFVCKTIPLNRLIGMDTYGKDQSPSKKEMRYEQGLSSKQLIFLSLFCLFMQDRILVGAVTSPIHRARVMPMLHCIYTLLIVLSAVWARIHLGGQARH